MKRIICLIFVSLITLGCAFSESAVYAYVTARQLNGRDRPSIHGIKESLYDYGHRLEETGNWSNDHKWIEVVGGELPTVWVSIDYITEEFGPLYFVNESYSRVKIRKSPVNGKITGYLKRGRTIKIDRIVMGWGHSKQGWIDLCYLTEIEGE